MDRFSKKHLQNIRDIFEKKTGVSLEEPPRSITPVVRVVMVAAVLSCLLTCCAVASSLGVGDSFKRFFGNGQDKPLSDGQQSYIEAHAAEMGESVTQNGVTVTVKGAITDGTMAYILLDVEAPEGTSVDGAALGFDVEFEGLAAQKEVHISGVGATCIPLADYDGASHTASMVIQYSVYTFMDGGFSFADGEKRLLELKDLRYHAVEYPYTMHTLGEGVWTYEIVFDVVENETEELLREPVAASYTQISGRQVNAVITSVLGKGLSADVYYTIETDEVQEGGDFGVLELVMKDGKVIRAYPEKVGEAVRMEEGFPVSERGEFYCTYVFEAPACYEDVISLRIAGVSMGIQS